MDPGCIPRRLATKICKKLARKNIRHYPNVAGFVFDVITIDIILNGLMEKEELEFLSSHVFPGLPSRNTCLDVGANIGNHALHFADHFAHVIALEPHPRTFGLLAFNAGLKDNVTPINVAASDRPGQATAVPTKDINIGTMSLSPGRDTRAHLADQAVTFQLARLDDLPEVQAAQSIDFMKIDVEGHEMACLRGAERILKRHRPVIAMEILERELEQGEPGTIAFLRTLGYAHFYQLQRWRASISRPRALASLLRLFMCTFFPSRTKDCRLVPLERMRPEVVNTVLCSTYPLQ